MGFGKLVKYAAFKGVDKATGGAASTVAFLAEGRKMAKATNDWNEKAAIFHEAGQKMKMRQEYDILNHLK